ncbi:putative Microfibrillar-associated protein [Blattamonas nauphoetae]|uniref:Microfibrillar-associated protein n=1 Tax=Blattamonas nauphoetae TaxID=2049346 RepID=A0ABQ9Y6D8_9EUKA|nr:putative Microfibrillar-associated protein [Blattamonas nauphoetae]
MSDSEFSSDGSYDSDDEDSSDDQPAAPQLRFIPRSQRRDTTNQPAEPELTEEELDRLNKQRIKETITSINRQIEADKVVDTAGDGVLNTVDDTDHPEDEIEFNLWQEREMKRIQRETSQRMQWLQEQEDILNRDKQSAESIRLAEKIHQQQEEEKEPRGKQKLYQKWYHKGAFFQGEFDVLKRDYTAPTGEDKLNKEALPEFMRKRDFGFASKSKWSHLSAEDTTKDGVGWGIQGLKKALWEEGEARRKPIPPKEDDK